ncbi:MAG: hypothetical protein OJF62_000733 [Pseudolabrys sp.]|jgi:hypothetical protein|nr:hypothetical protein [Pseudolabrys sp.]
MADYTPLIARAVAGLESNTAENRRVLYERARSALMAQLRGIDPPLPEDAIAAEQASLDDAIRAVEDEAAAAQHSADAEAAAKAPETPAKPSLAAEALRGFRKTVAEKGGLDQAQAGQPARDVPPPRPAAPAPEPFPPSYPAHESPADKPADAESRHEHPPFAGHDAPAPPSEPPHARHEDEADDDEPYPARARSYRGLVALLVILALVIGVGAVGYWQRQHVVALANRAVAMLTSIRSKPATTPKTAETPSPSQPKITDRVTPQEGQSSQNKPAAAPAADVAQKVVLFEEDPNNPQGKRYVGSVVWHTDTVSPGPGLSPELAVRADVEIPERKMRMTWTLRRNTDKALPASHTIEIMFTLPADFAEGGIQNVPGVLMKQNEMTRGVPLAGLTVKVTNNFFLIGLNSTDIDKQRNIALLKERPWFDVPIVYNTGKRAIMAIEKGPPGERAFTDAFRAWGE